MRGKTPAKKTQIQTELYKCLILLLELCIQIILAIYMAYANYIS